MINYYQILNINPELDAIDLKKEILKVQKKWIIRQNAPDLKRRQEAERILSIIQEAEKILCDDVKRREYDDQLSNYVNEELVYEGTEGQDCQSFISVAWDLLRENHYADAIIAAKEAVTINGDNPDAWEVLGYSCYMWNNYDDSIQSYNKAIDLVPNNASYYYDLCNVYIDHPDMNESEKYNKAIEFNQKALYISPNEDPYQLQNALINYNLENYDQAIETLEKLIAQDPDNPVCKSLLASSYYNKGLTEFFFYNEDNGLRYIIDPVDGEKALECFQKASIYGEGQDDVNVNQISELIDNTQNSLQKRFDFPGIKAFVMPTLLLFVGLVSLNLWLSIIMIALIGLICYTNYAPSWKINKVNLGLNEK